MRHSPFLEVPCHALKTKTPLSSICLSKKKSAKGTRPNERGALNTLDSIKTAPQKHPLPPKTEADIQGQTS